MKKYFVAFLFIISVSSVAQIVNIPDANFKANLLEADVTNSIAYGNGGYIKIDANDDGQIQEIEAQAVDSLIVLNAIEDLSGIVSFTNLKKLDCSYNSISSIDVSNMTSLTHLICMNQNNNMLSSLNLNGAINLTYLDCSFGQLTTLDVAALTNLNYLSCSYNQINSIEISTSLNLEYFDCRYNQISLLNLNGLTNLKTLSCGFNNLATLDVSDSTLLTYLSCEENSLTSLNINEVNNLIGLNCSNNQLTLLDVSNLTDLTDLYCYSNQISELNVTNLVNLIFFNCLDNSLTSLDVSNLINLNQLECEQNQINSLNITGAINLSLLDFAQNLLTSVNLSGLVNLYQLSCDNNLLASIDVSGLENLHYFSCGNNLFTTIDVTGLTNLSSFGCYNNQLTVLDVSQNLNLNLLYCSNNFLSVLDVAQNLGLTTINCSNNVLTTLDISPLSFVENVNCQNNQLTSLFIKTGYWNTSVDFFNNPNLQYICTDESFIIDYQNTANFYGYNCTVNSYCSFTPSGNYNTLTGSVTFDGDNNGCDASDSPHPYMKININDGTSQGSTFTANSGVYNFYTQAGSFDITPSVENPSLYTFSPITATIPFANNNNNVVTQNFCIATNGVHPNVEIVIAPITPARPGFDAKYQIVYKNIGNQLTSGTIDFSYDDAVLDFVSATVAPNGSGAGILNWNYTNLVPFESRTIYVTLNVNSPQETPPVNIGDQLYFTTSITSSAGDEMVEDNFFGYQQTVVGSYDPNDITCIEGDVVPPSEIGEYLHYVINFENTGTAAAENIVVRTDVDATQFDVNSLQMLNTSHNAYIRQTGATIEFIFEGIYLDTGGHGNVLLKIKSLNNLQEGDAVAKQANIFFDYNFPIETNMANTTFQALSTPGFEIDESILVYPNPTNSIININSNNNIQSVQLYDVQGRLLQTQIINNQLTTVDLSQQSNGIYFVKVVSDQGIKVEKVVKK